MIYDNGMENLLAFWKFPNVEQAVQFFLSICLFELLNAFQFNDVTKKRVLSLRYIYDLKIINLCFLHTERIMFAQIIPRTLPSMHSQYYLSYTYIMLHIGPSRRTALVLGPPITIYFKLIYI